MAVRTKGYNIVSPQNFNDNNQYEDLASVLSEEQISNIDPFDRPQLSYVIKVCRESKSLSEAGRKLFSVSRANKKAVNDSDRIRKYLSKFDLDWNKLNS